MPLTLFLPTPDDTELLDTLDEFAAQRFPEELRCRISAPEAPLYPQRDNLQLLVQYFSVMVCTDGREPSVESLYGYAVVSKNDGAIHWLIAVEDGLAQTVEFFCREALRRWDVLLHGIVENPLVNQAIVDGSSQIEHSPTEIVFNP